MKNKQKTMKINDKYSRSQIKEMVLEDDEIIFEIMENDLSYEEMKIIYEVFREVRLDDFFDYLNIDSEKINKTKRQIIKLKPNSKDFRLISKLFKNHNGKYYVEHLFNEYHDQVIQDGSETGFDYGRKFIVEDLQNNRFTKEDIINMSEEEINEYIYENRKTI